MPVSLYKIWQQQVAQNPQGTAVIDSASGESFSFAAIDASLGEAQAYQQGMSVDFLRQTLAAWRDGQPSIPIENDAQRYLQTSEIPEGIAHVKTTSGSTGTPRQILFTADQLAADARNIVRTMELRPELPNVGVISMAHSYGFSNLVLPLVLHGIPLILGGDPLPESFARALTFLPDTGGTVPAVPAMWRAWLKAGCLDPHKIKIAISAGAPLTTELEAAVYQATGIKVHNFYGSSECGGIAYDRSDTPRENPNAVGHAMHGVTTTLSRDGNLTVSGEAVGQTYWPDPDPTTLSDSRFVTSDLAEISTDGIITLRGRAGDLINIAGRKLDPGTVEAQLLQHPAVDHCVVFGISSNDPERVQEIVAICNAGDPAELRAHLATHLPAWQSVRHWWITKELKPNTRGKLPRSDWRDRWEKSR